MLVFSLLLASCGIHPEAWQPPVHPGFTGAYALNDSLTQTRLIDLLGWVGPEEFAFDTAGNAYCGVHRGVNEFAPGAILKISPTGQVTEWLRTEGWLAGLLFDKHSHLIALIHGQGLVRITPQKQVEVLVSHDTQGRPLLMGSGLAQAEDGTLYFANLSTTQTASSQYINQLLLEQKATGGIYQYHPPSGRLTELSDGNYFGNGVALSADESFLLVSETAKYRILSYHLTGPKTGTWGIFMDNLPGFPNNLSLRSNGNFCVGLSKKSNDALDKIHPKPDMKKLIYGLPAFLKPKAEAFGMILEITPDAAVARALFDPNGTRVPEAGAAKEHSGKLYIGGDVVPYVAVYDLTNHTPVHD